MSRDRVRLLHAAALRLDDLPPVAAVLSSAAREVVSRAAFRALKSAVAAALDQNVDLVLLAGDTFDDSVRSLRGRIALREAFQQLDERNIPVLVAPGHRDPRGAWARFPGLPGNVTLAEPDETVVIDRDGAPIVAVEGITSRSAARRDADDEAGAPFRVAVMLLDETPDRSAGRSRKRGAAKSETLTALYESVNSAAASSVSAESDGLPAGEAAPVEALEDLPWDYIAPSAIERQIHWAADRTVLHSPGAMLAARGASLVTLRAGRRAECEFVPLSPLAVKTVAIRVHPRDSEEDLVARMQEAVRRHVRSSGEEWLLMRWSLRGSGPLFLALADREYQALLAEAVDEEASRRSLQLGHSFQLGSTRFDAMAGETGEGPGDATIRPAWPGPRPAVWTEEGLSAGSGERAPSLIEQAAEAFRVIGAESTASGEEHAASFAWRSAEPFDLRLTPVLARIDAAGVTAGAARLIESWFDHDGDAARRNS